MLKRYYERYSTIGSRNLRTNITQLFETGKRRCCIDDIRQNRHSREAEYLPKRFDENVREM